MATDTEKRHWECTKCKGTFSQMEHYSAKEQKCPKGGTHNLKVVQQSWNNSLLGASVNLVGKGIKAGAKAGSKAASNYANHEVSEDEKEQKELRKQQAAEEAKIKNQKLANKTIKSFNIVRPYLKFIIPLYLICFTIAYFLVENKQLVLIFFGVSLVGLIYLAYNAIINKPKS